MMYATSINQKEKAGKFGLMLVLPIMAALFCLLLVSNAKAADSWERNYNFIENRTPDQLRSLYGFRLPDNFEQEFSEKLKIYKAPGDLPSNFDWRDSDGVTSVKDQGSCGSCWAFAAVAQIESHLKIYYGYDMNLSEQQTIFCNPYGADCGGGWASAVYNVADSYGLNREAAEPYLGANGGTCNQTNFLPFGFVYDWNYVDNGVTQIKTALLEGPVCSAFDAEYPFTEYGSGCYDAPGGSWTNHLILIVGWDDRACDGNGGWICKNSWGTDFGEAGYFTIQYGASLIGSSTTQIQLELPPVEFTYTGPLAATPMIAGQTTDITWSTSGAACSTVDIWVSYVGEAYTEQIAQGIPNTGSFTWLVENVATTNLQFCIVADGDTRNGFGLSSQPLTIIGHKTRYVAASGSATAPYDSPATAAHTITDAVYACTGFDSVMIAGADYAETFLVDGTVRIFGGWSSDFSTRDPEVYPTRLKGTNSAMRFSGQGDGFAGVDGVTFYDCQGALYSNPSYGRHGGAILAMNASPTITNCVFENCRADFSNGYGSGGAIMAWGGSPVIEDCVFTGNSAQHGGAIALYGTLDAQLNRNVYTANANSDSTASTSRGAAIYCSTGSVVMDGEVFAANGGTYTGGAIYAADVQLTGRNLDFEANRSVNNGGGLYATGGTLDLTGGSFLNNTSGASGGGGLQTASVNTYLRNILFAGNVTLGMGGGFSIQSVPAAGISNCVLYGNSATALFGGAFCQGSAMTLRNNIIAGNNNGGIGGGVTSLDMDYNLTWDNTGGNIISLTPGANLLVMDPLFKDAAAGDFGLGLHSPAVDTADPDAAYLDPDGTRGDRGLFGGPEGVSMAPMPATGLAAVSLGGSTYRLNWDASTDPQAARYVVYCCSGTDFVPDVAAMVGLVDHPVAELQGSFDPNLDYTVAVVSSDGYMGGLAAPVSLPAGPSGVKDLPGVMAIRGIAPNPFNPSTKISFDLPAASRVRLSIFDMRGREIRALVDTEMGPGSHTATWNGRDDSGAAKAAGVYLVRLSAAGKQVTRKIVMAK